MIPEAYANLAWLWALQADRRTFKPEIEVFANFPSNYMSLINEDESIEFTDGALRLIDATGNIIEDGITATRYTEVIGEAVEPYSYTKFAYYKPLGYPEGSYRVGPLARLNIVKPWARQRPKKNSPSSSSWPPGRSKLVPLSPRAAGRDALRH
jgi:NAD-reducing hydrogenase large subunit